MKCAGRERKIEEMYDIYRIFVREKKREKKKKERKRDVDSRSYLKGHNREFCRHKSEKKASHLSSKSYSEKRLKERHIQV